MCYLFARGHRLVWPNHVNFIFLYLIYLICYCQYWVVKNPIFLVGQFAGTKTNKLVFELQVLGQGQILVLQRVKKKISLEFNWILEKNYLARWNSLRVLRRTWRNITMFVVFNLFGCVEPFIKFGLLEFVDSFVSWFVGGLLRFTEIRWNFYGEGVACLLFIYYLAI